MSERKHGDLVRSGDEYNHDPWYHCEQCGYAHSVNYKDCDGLLKPVAQLQSIRLEKLEALLDELIDTNQDLAKILMEKHLARIELRRRLIAYGTK